MKKIIQSLGIVILILFAAVSYSDEKPAAVSLKSSLELIDAAFQTGSISSGDRLYLGLQSLLAPSDLPDEFKSDATVSPIKCGTPYLSEVLGNWDLLSRDQQMAASQLMARPPLESLYISPEGYFAIHYSFIYPDSVSAEDLDMSGVPDYVERIGLYADSTYRHYHNTLAYYYPPSDGDEYYDIYIMGIGQAYGITIREDPGDYPWYDYQSHIRINCNLNSAQNNDDPEGKVIGAQKVTCAHEYYHAVQLGHAFLNGDDIWFTEGSATFFEDVVFDIVNDNYSYLKYFFNYPDTSLVDPTPTPTLHDYGTFIWDEFITENFGIGIMKDIQENLRYNSLFPSIDGALAAYGESMASIFPRFVVWNYFTGDRADILYYDEGFNYPQIDTILQVIQECPFTDVVSERPPDGLAANYLMAYPDGDGQSGLLHIGFDGVNTVEWDFSYVVFRDNIAEPVIGCGTDALGKTDCGIYHFVRYDSIMFAPCVISPWHDDNNFNFDVTIRPFGDVDGSGALNLLDITYLISFVYKGGINPRYSVHMGDVNCTGDINIMDIIHLIGYLYHDGPEPCGYDY